MTVKITPKSGPVGTPITVNVKGIGWRSLFNSWDLLYDNHFTGWMSAVTTGDRRPSRSRRLEDPACMCWRCSTAN